MYKINILEKLKLIFFILFFKQTTKIDDREWFKYKIIQKFDEYFDLDVKPVAEPHQMSKNEVKEVIQSYFTQQKINANNMSEILQTTTPEREALKTLLKYLKETGEINKLPQNNLSGISYIPISSELIVRLLAEINSEKNL